MFKIYEYLDSIAYKVPLGAVLLSGTIATISGLYVAGDTIYDMINKYQWLIENGLLAWALGGFFVLVSTAVAGRGVRYLQIYRHRRKAANDEDCLQRPQTTVIEFGRFLLITLIGVGAALTTDAPLWVKVILWITSAATAMATVLTGLILAGGLTERKIETVTSTLENVLMEERVVKIAVSLRIVWVILLTMIAIALTIFSAWMLWPTAIQMLSGGISPGEIDLPSLLQIGVLMSGGIVAMELARRSVLGERHWNEVAFVGGMIGAVVMFLLSVAV